MKQETEENYKFYDQLDDDVFDSFLFDINSIPENISLNESVILKGNYIGYHYLCLKCFSFPYIQIANINRIYYICDCYKGEKKLIDIKEFINNKNGYITKFDYKYRKDPSKNKGLMCNEHNHKFKYYCKKCDINI